jgi:hypothetical protein
LPLPLKSDAKIHKKPDTTTIWNKKDPKWYISGLKCQKTILKCIYQNATSIIVRGVERGVAKIDQVYADGKLILPTSLNVM